MTPVEAAAVAAIRAHAEKHRKSGRATFSVAGIELLLKLYDERTADPQHLDRVLNTLSSLDNELGDAPVLMDAVALLRKLREPA